MNKRGIFFISAVVLFLGLIQRVSAGSCEEKTINKLLTLTCKGYEDIPKEEREDEGVIKSLDMSEGNKIAQLYNKDFKQDKLKNIEKLTMSNCQMRQIEDEALTDLPLLKDIDLSHNQIKDIPLHIFSGNAQLKIINLGNNRNLSELRGQFPKISTLITIDLSNCNLSRLNEDTFQQVINLERLYLNGNILKTISPKLTVGLSRLDTITLANNTWDCNCHLREFVKARLTAKSIAGNSEKPMCHAPPEFANKNWENVDPNDFSCDPKIELIKVNEKAIADGETQIFHFETGQNITIACEIWADPAADINWRKDDIAVTNSNINERHSIEVSYSEVDNRMRISTLTIINCEKQDTGNYQCHAENRGGAVQYVAKVNITSPFVPPPILSGGKPSRLWLWILIGLLCAAIVIAIITAIIFFVWRRRQRTHKILRKEVMEKFKGSQNVLDEENKDDDKNDKAPLLNDRVDGTPKSLPSISASGTETASFSHIDFGRSPEQVFYQQQNMQRSVPPSPSIYGRMIPGSRPGSSQSVFLPDAESSRQMSHQNANNKIDMMSFDAVRYHRRPPSVDSFMSLPAPETHRLPNGYVTLPRKPRNPRWSTSTTMTEDSYHTVHGRPSSVSSQQPMTMYSTLPYKKPAKRRPTILSGPHYDAVGPRTTVDGSSNLSLNKIAGGSMNALDSINSALSTSPTRGKIVTRKSRTASAAITPGTGRSMHSSFNFEPIEEVESTPATSEININIKPRTKEDSNTLGPKYKKKKPPSLTNLNRIKTPSNFHQRISEINKSFERPKSSSDITFSKETEISDTTTDSESSVKKGFPKPPPKPLRTLSAPEYNDNSSVMFGVIHEEAEGTAV